MKGKQVYSKILPLKSKHRQLLSSKTLSLQNRLFNELAGAKRVAILGVGSELRGDDFAGMLTAQTVKKFLKAKKLKLKVEFFFGDVAPENLTGEIKRFKPSHLIILDSADFNQKPGTIDMIDSKTMGGITFSTHKLPTLLLSEYLSRFAECKVLHLGIQPRSVHYSFQVSSSVQKAALVLAKLVSQSLSS